MNPPETKQIKIKIKVKVKEVEVEVEVKAAFTGTPPFSVRLGSLLDLSLNLNLPLISSLLPLGKDPGDLVL